MFYSRRSALPLFLTLILVACSQSEVRLEPSALAPARQLFSISTLPPERVMVALAFGQSNSANHGSVLNNGDRNVYNFYQGKLYEAQDPLLGATGSGGSVWTRLGRRLISSKKYDAVVFVTVGVGGSEIGRWTPGGDLHPRVIGAIRDLKAQGLDVTHLLWHQGEADNRLGTSQDAYRERFLRLLSSIRSQGVDAPIYVSTTTRCGSLNPNEHVRQAQIKLIDAGSGILAGPDTDVLVGVDRKRDGCHFSDVGLGKFADLWLEKLGSVGAKTPQQVAFDLTGVSKTAGEAAFSVAAYASASSGLRVQFSSRTTARCTVTPDGTVTPVAAGHCILSAIQPGDATYAAAAPLDQTLNLSPDPALVPNAEHYLMNFEETPTDRLIYRVGMGGGVTHQAGDNPASGTVPVVGQPHRGGRLLRTRQARVVDVYGGKRLTVASPRSNTPSPQGGRIRLAFAPALNPAGVELTSVTLSNLTSGAYLRFFYVGGGSSLQRVEKAAAGESLVVPLEASRVRAVDIVARSAFAVDDLAFVEVRN